MAAPNDATRHRRRNRFALPGGSRSNVLTSGLLAATTILSAFVLAPSGCGSGGGASSPASSDPAKPSAPTAHDRTRRGHAEVPALLSRHDVYAADRANRLIGAVRRYPYRVYVPNSESDTVMEIDPKTFKVVRRFSTGAQPQHVTPSYDMRTLWVDNDQGNSLTPIDPRTGRPGKRVPVADPYNLYFTPNGSYAIV